ncbi:MAG TPA: hypothetical protein VGY96_23670 [Streptosporangiaceae bacterium]|nr:hypothetical protein [Streptosporangiaceae bacterium]
MEWEGIGRSAGGWRGRAGPGGRVGGVAWVRAARVLGLVAGGVVVLAGGAGLLVGCSSSGVLGVGATCGTTRTAADVPVIIKVIKGTVSCGVAMNVENEYAAKIRAGQVRGNGGGAPVAVSGWTCQGYPTPEVLSTGNASQCHTGSATIVAVLPVPTPGVTSTAG